MWCVLACLCAWVCSCGGGGGGGTTGTTAQVGGVHGYVYAPVGSGARAAGAVPAGYKPVQNAAVTILCGATQKNDSTNSSGYFSVSSLPAGVCTLSVAFSGFGDYAGNVTVNAGSTTTVGGSSGIQLAPTSAGSIKVTANVSGGEVVIDGDESGVTILSSLSYTFNNIAPGSHTVSIQQSGYDTVSPQTVSVSQGETASVSFMMNPTGNRAPVADAGDDAKGFSGFAFTYQGWNGTTQVFTPYEIFYTLNGINSSDQDGDDLIFHWEQISGPSIALDDASASQPHFIPLQEGSYEFALKVNDGYIDSATDTVIIDIVKPTGKLVFQSAMPQVSYEIYSWALDSDSYTMLTERSYDDTNPAWSPDGESVIFVCDPVDYTEICIINSDGSGYTRLTNNTDSDITPAFSLDGMKAIYAKGSLASSYGIYSMGTDGSNNTQMLSSSNWVFAPEYSPDGSKILFISDYGSDNYEIMVMDSDGSNVSRLTNNTTAEFHTTWMPDGKILYTSRSSLGVSAEHLYVMNADGTGQQEIPIPSEINDIYNMTVSSDGRFIFFSDDDGYLWVMYADGSAAMNYGIYGSNPDYHPGP